MKAMSHAGKRARLHDASMPPIATYKLRQAIGLDPATGCAMHLLRRVVVLLMFAGTATAGPVPHRSAHGLLVDDAGHTLYSYDPDGTSGTSRCNGPCATAWPPYPVDHGSHATGDYSVATRVDGVRQWVYRGRPLYLFAGDEKPGDRDGDGVNGSWHVVPGSASTVRASVP
jgi:predicted lipoprotein with Yx(FWY)xxD motif